MAIAAPKKTPKNLKKPKRKPLRKSLKPKERPDVVDLTPPEDADQLLIKKKDGGKFPDLNKDGKVTFADVLKGRGVDKMAMGGKCRGMGAATRGGNFNRNG